MQQLGLHKVLDADAREHHQRHDRRDEEEDERDLHEQDLRREEGGGGVRKG